MFAIHDNMDRWNQNNDALKLPNTKVYIYTISFLRSARIGETNLQSQEYG